MSNLGLPCLVWDVADQVQFRHEPAAFLRDFPSAFECDLRLRLPRIKEGAFAGATSAASYMSLFLCRHVHSISEAAGAWEEVPPQGLAGLGPPPHPVALVKSCLQKAIRRGLPLPALAAASYLLAREPKELMRRLPVILAEDVGAFADLPGLTWLMIAVQAGYKLRESDAHFVLRLTVTAALWRGAPTTVSTPPEAEMREAVGLLQTPTDPADSTESLRRCFVLRACYGGMPFDIEMLLAYAARPQQWQGAVAPPGETDRVAENIVWEWFAGARSGGSIARLWAGEIREEARLEAAVDNHCSDIVPQLLRRLRHLQAPGAQPEFTEESVKAALWSLRGSVNCRRPVGGEASPPAPPWWDKTFEAELSALSRAAWAPRHRGSEALGVPATSATAAAAPSQKIAAPGREPEAK
eukprot:CAMPEP_0170309622 /NCGR_PEP_ID=MMETSP0116_2-20130129/55280_1 /TAXON_ID=400756 /ORGANISM="Durinskia baltica, Strain CSIRO CS-38" /LENGTH=410 /DNA_ID=CAMNT_0010561863 /DNA_START=27 /DNA_END=1256 /DNA_ORIENTATION=-